MKDAAAWLARYRRFWEERYEQLDELLEPSSAPRRRRHRMAHDVEEGPMT